MSIKAKWHTRQISLELLSYIVCFTTVLVVVPAVIDMKKFLDYGMDFYQGAKWPKGCDVRCVNFNFWTITLYPKLKWLPLTLLADAIFRRWALSIRD
jgi:hypothetical protein